MVSSLKIMHARADMQTCTHSIIPRPAHPSGKSRSNSESLATSALSKVSVKPTSPPDLPPPALRVFNGCTQFDSGLATLSSRSDGDGGVGNHAACVFTQSRARPSSVDEGFVVPSNTLMTMLNSLWRAHDLRSRGEPALALVSPVL